MSGEGVVRVATSDWTIDRWLVRIKCDRGLCSQPSGFKTSSVAKGDENFVKKET